MRIRSVEAQWSFETHNANVHLQQLIVQLQKKKKLITQTMSVILFCDILVLD